MSRAPAVGWLLAAAAAAQGETLQVFAPAHPAGAHRIDVMYDAVLAPHSRVGPAGYLTCTCENPDVEPHELTLRIGDWQGKVEVRDQLRLAAGQRVTRHYPVQRFAGGLHVSAQCDRGREVSGQGLGVKTALCAVLLITDRPELAGVLQAELTRLVEAAEQASAGSGSKAAARGAQPARVVAPGMPARGARVDKVGIAQAVPHQLPEQWQCYAGFDVLVVDGRCALPPAAEQAIVDALAAGARVFVPFAGSLADGPLRRAAGNRTAGTVAFGRFLLAAEGPATAAELPAWLRDGGLLAGSPRTASGPASDWLHAALLIPGLGRIPVLAFFVLLTLFVVVAGPINIFLCRRAGRPLLVAVTLPVLGFGFATAILVWGILAEGLGVRGSVRSVTWLDQRAHLSVNQAGASFYPGLTPAALAPLPSTSVTSLALQTHGWSRDDSPHRLLVDHAAGGRIAGSLLPARWQTHLVTVSVRRARERLRFRRVGDGTLEGLLGPDLVPRPPGVALRDHAGAHWLGVPQGDRLVLRRSDAAAVRAFLTAGRAALQGVSRNEVQIRFGGRFGAAPPPPTIPAELAGLFEELQPGSYAAWLAANTAFDSLGLEVAWEEPHHLVLGLLAEEDIVD